MEINNGITNQEREEVIAAIEAILAGDEHRLKNVTTRSGYIYNEGIIHADREILAYLKKRWQV